MDELIDYLRNNTHLTRFSRGELREVIERMDQDGWEIVRKSDGVIVETLPGPDPFAPRYEWQTDNALLVEVPADDSSWLRG